MYTPICKESCTIATHFEWRQAEATGVSRHDLEEVFRAGGCDSKVLGRMI